MTHFVAAVGILFGCRLDIFKKNCVNDGVDYSLCLNVFLMLLKHL